MCFEWPHPLRDREIRVGERWIYSAGFNVRRDLSSTARIDTELADLHHILAGGGRLGVLSHQAMGADGRFMSLDFVADYLSSRLGTVVDYFPGNDSPAAVARSDALLPGTAVLFGNTRQHEGEQRNDPQLARRFAALGDVVAVGGFAKAHRAHASNVGLLRYLPGYLSDSVIREFTLLMPWAGRSSRYSIAVLGGVKREKTVIGLRAFAATYDVIVPGGAVLNNVLRALGYDIGASDLGEDSAECLAVAREVLARRVRAAIHIPDKVVVAKPHGNGFVRTSVMPVAAGVPPGWAIVDFVLRPWLRNRLDLLSGGGRAIIAGTPCRYTDGFRGAANEILSAFASPGVDALLLGGDTVAELPWAGPASTGGGAALHFLAQGTCPIVDAVRSAPNARVDHEHR